MSEQAETKNQAMENLTYIRDTMARTAPLTAISGKATMAMGVIALVGGYFASTTRMPDGFIYIWLAVAVVGCLTGFAGMVLKNRRMGQAVRSVLNPRFLLAFVPPIVAGICITEALYEGGQEMLMPGVWLLLYGTAVITGGAHAPRIVPLMGLFFMLLGVFALLDPIWVRNGFVAPGISPEIFLAAGFGGLHLFFGAVITWRYDG